MKKHLRCLLCAVLVLCALSFSVSAAATEPLTIVCDQISFGSREIAVSVVLKDSVTDGACNLTYDAGQLTLLEVSSPDSDAAAINGPAGVPGTAMDANMEQGNIRISFVFDEGSRSGDTVLRCRFRVRSLSAAGSVRLCVKDAVLHHNGRTIACEDKEELFFLGGSETVGSATSKPTEPMDYTDVSKTDRYYEDILYVYENGIMNGVGSGKFAPDATLTRAMVVTILYRMEGEPAVRYNAMFSDVENYQWYTEGVEWAAREGIVLGYTTGKFGPNDPVTREQLAAILYRYAQSKNYALTAGADLGAMADASSISPYAVTAMQWSVAEDLLDDANGKLLPRENATRAEVAHAIAGFCRNVGK